MTQTELMHKLTAYGFAAFEWNLYLDTHPHDKMAIEMHSKMSKKAEELQKEYESKYGPITSSASRSTEVWDWVDEPWPWDK